jgi:ribosomal protein L7Ae-like RNA K-turn-binding protein
LTAYIGFAARARKLKSGDFTCEKLMKQKKVQLMLLDSGVSANTREKYEALCSAAEIDCLYIEDLGRLIGKDAHKTAAVTDRHFAGIIREAYQATEQAN